MSGKGLGQLQSILSRMNIHQTDKLREAVKKYGNSEMFRYATQAAAKPLPAPKSLQTWDQFEKHDLKHSSLGLPLNGFEEMIQLTEQGKLWKYPIDNEQGLEEEKQVPFEDHVFLDHLLEDLPKNEYIQNFMSTVISGLARNNWMTVSRKHEIIRFYKDYFEERRDAYERSGYKI